MRCSFFCVYVHLCAMFFLRYLWFALMDFYQTSVSGETWDKDELIRFWGQKVKVPA